VNMPTRSSDRRSPIRRLSARPVASLALVALIVMGACQTAPTEDDGAVPFEPEIGEQQSRDDQRAEWLAAFAREESLAVTPEPLSAPSSTPVLFTVPAQDGSDDAIERARISARLADDRIETLVEGFIDEGLAALRESDIAAAHEHFARAVELDPTNEVARDYYNRTGSLSGDEAASLGALATDARTLTKSRRQQRTMDIGHQLELGDDALAAGDAERAMHHFEDALTLIRFNPDVSRGSDNEQDVVQRIAVAEAAIAAQNAERDEELARRALQAQEEWDFAERNRTTLKIQGLMRSANESFLRDDFELAIESLNEALRLDPAHEDAQDLRRIATKANHEQASREIRRAYRKQWNRTFDELRHVAVIPNDLLSFPSSVDWANTVARGPKSFAETAGGRPIDDQAVADRLDEMRIPYDFNNNTLGEVLDNLGQITTVNFIMSPDVLAEADNQNYTLRDRNPQKVSRILKIILEDQSNPPMTYSIRDSIVRVITSEESPGDVQLEMYDIRDLTFTPVDHAAEDFNLTPSGTDTESFTEGIEDEEPLPLVSDDTLQSLILENISPLSWTENENASISLMPGTLIVKQTPAVHDQIRQLLADLRRNQNTLISIQTRFVEVEDSFLEDIGVDLRGLSPADGGILDDFGQPNAGGVGTPSDPDGIGTGIDPGAFYQGSDGNLAGRTENLFDSLLGEEGVLTGGGGLSLEALFLDDTNLNAVLSAVTKYQNSNVVNAPSLTLRSGQRGNIKVLDNRTYVRDFEPEIATGAVIAQPELGVVKSGITLDVRAVASADRRFVTLELRPTVAELVPDANGNVLPEQLVSLGTPNANNVTIQLPELAIQRLRTTATLPDGATLLLGGLKNSLEQDYTSDMPFLADIPILSFFFSRQGQ